MVVLVGGRKIVGLLLCLLLGAFSPFILQANAQSRPRVPTQPLPLPPSLKRLAELYNKAGALQHAGKLDEALKTYQEFLRLARALHQPPQTQLLGLAQIYNIYAARKDLQGIGATLKQIVAIQPTNAEAWARLARIAAAHRDWPKAKTFAQRALGLKPPATVAAEAHAVLGMVGLGQQRFAEARQQLAEAVHLNPNDLDVRYNYAFALYSLGDLRDAELQAKIVCQKMPKNLPALFLLATIRQAGRDLADALATYNQILAVDPYNHEALFNRAALAQQIGEVQEAEKAYLALFKVYPKDARAHFNCGLLYTGLRDYPKARSQFLLAVPLLRNGGKAEAPLLQKTLQNLAQVEAQMAFSGGDPVLRQQIVQQAEQHYKEAIALDPKNMRLLYQLAMLYRSVGRYQQARAIYQQRLKEDPTDSSAVSGLADVAFLEGKPDEAVAIWRDYVQHNPKDLIAHVQYAQVLELRGQWKDAADQRAQLVSLNPEDGADMLAEAHDRLQANQLNEAQALYQKVLLLKPSPQKSAQAQTSLLQANLASWRLTALQGLANVAQKQNQLADALRYLQQAAEEDRAYAQRNHTSVHEEPYLEIASIYEKQNLPDKAIQTLKTLADLLPLDSKPYAEMAPIYEREGKIEEAVDSFLKASQRDKNALTYILQAADIYRSHKMYDKAVALYRQNEKRFPANIELLSALAQTLEQSGQDAEALTVYQQIAKANHSLSWVLDKEATILTRLKRYPEAIALRQQEIASAPNNPQAYTDLLHLYELEGKPQDGLIWLQSLAQQQPDNAAVLSALLTAYSAQKQESRGVEFLQSLSTSHPTNAVVLACVQALQNQGFKKEALAMMRQLAQKQPAALSIQQPYASMLADSGDKQGAIEVYRKFLQQGNISASDRLQARQQLAQQLQNTGDIAGAQEQYQQILNESPNDLQSLLNLVSLWKSQGKTNQIISFCTNLVAKPGLSQLQRAWLYVVLGNAFEQQKNVAEARAQYQAALRCMPDFPPAEAALAHIPSK